MACVPFLPEHPKMLSRAAATAATAAAVTTHYAAHSQDHLWTMLSPQSPDIQMLSTSYPPDIQRLNQPSTMTLHRTHQGRKTRSGWSSTSSRPKNDSKCYLQDLPGEIRNIIYRLAVLEPRSIAVHSKGYSRSGLLAVNQEIRKETIKIFYYENHFDIAALELNSSTLAQWCVVLDRLRIPPRQVSMVPFIRQTAHWTNLINWIHRWHAGVIPARLTYPDHLHNAEVRAVHAMFDTAMTLRNQPWCLVRAVLENQRSVLVAMNPAWAADL